MPSDATPSLSGDELCALVARVFRPRPEDRRLAILVDLPDAARPDTAAWRERRELAASWARALEPVRSRLGLEEVGLILYRNVRANNADLPERARLHPLAAPLPDDAEALGSLEPMLELLARYQLLIAPTELSATAPLKLAAPRLGFRAATMPGFGPAMLGALRLDYDEISRRVLALCALLDGAERAELRFVVAGVEESLTIDLRHRRAHASTGLLHEPGTAGNLPSGEAYIVPYEGEREGDPSASAGVLPVQLEDEVVRYRVEGNRALGVLGAAGPVARAEAERLAREPAYGNLAELGLGVLAELGVEPCGELLLDEKLGLHLAFGRSDHFGGVTGAARFSRPEAVVHIDRVYLPSLQPRVQVRRVELVGPAGQRIELIRDDRYALDFARPPRF